MARFLSGMKNHVRSFNGRVSFQFRGILYPSNPTSRSQSLPKPPIRRSLHINGLYFRTACLSTRETRLIHGLHGLHAHGPNGGTSEEGSDGSNIAGSDSGDDTSNSSGSDSLWMPGDPLPSLKAARLDGEASLDPMALESTRVAAEARRIEIQEAHAAGQLGFGFSAGGFLYCYHLGVLWELERLKILKVGTLMAGASAGSLAIATFNSGIREQEATKALREFAADCRDGGTSGRLSGLLRDFLHSYLPDDAHMRCSSVCHVAVTRFFPYLKREIVSEFSDKDDLVEALLTSCHIPLYANGSWVTRFRGRYYVDGAVTDFTPSPPSRKVVKVCCFPVNKAFARVQPSLQGMGRLSSLLDIDISPDAHEPFPYKYRTLLKWALLPAPDEVLDMLIDKGRKDAEAWARSMGLAPTLS